MPSEARKIGAGPQNCDFGLLFVSPGARATPIRALLLSRPPLLPRVEDVTTSVEVTARYGPGVVFFGQVINNSLRRWLGVSARGDDIRASEKVCGDGSSGVTLAAGHIATAADAGEAASVIESVVHSAGCSAVSTAGTCKVK